MPQLRIPPGPHSTPPKDPEQAATQKPEENAHQPLQNMLKHTDRQASYG